MNREPETATPSPFTGNTYRPAHQFSEPFRNCQAEPGSPVFARSRVVGLRKAFKQSSLGGDGNTYTRIGNCESQHYSARALALPRNVQSNAAFVGKLHSVGQKVQKNLSKPNGITNHPGWEILIEHKF